MSQLWTCQLKEFPLLWEFIKLFQSIQGFPELSTHYRGGMNLSKIILPTLLLGNRDSEFCYYMLSVTELWHSPPHLCSFWVLSPSSVQFVSVIISSPPAPASSSSSVGSSWSSGPSKICCSDFIPLLYSSVSSLHSKYDHC